MRLPAGFPRVGCGSAPGLPSLLVMDFTDVLWENLLPVVQDDGAKQRLISDLQPALLGLRAFLPSSAHPWRGDRQQRRAISTAPSLTCRTGLGGFQL